MLPKSGRTSVTGRLVCSGAIALAAAVVPLGIDFTPDGRIVLDPPLAWAGPNGDGQGGNGAEFGVGFGHAAPADSNPGRGTGPADVSRGVPSRSTSAATATAGRGRGSFSDDPAPATPPLSTAEERSVIAGSWR